MNAPAHKFMSADEFLIWSLDQVGRWELVRGVPIRAMTGATTRHDVIVVNLIFQLKGRLRGGPCAPRTADQAVRTAPNSVRRPDVTVDCGPTPDEAMEITRPTVTFEVLSPSTHKTDRFRKLDEYKALESIAHVALIDPDRPIVLLYTRGPDGTWTNEEIEGLDRSIRLSAISVDLPMSEIYEGLIFREATEASSG